MTTPSKHDGAAEQNNTPPPQPSFFKRFFVFCFGLALISFLLLAAVLMVPGRWSPWLQQELSSSTGLEVSWERFAWRGMGGFQIVNFEVRAPDGSLNVAIPKIPFGWSLGVSQYPSFRVNALEIRDVVVYYLDKSEVDEPPKQSEPVSAPRDASQLEALLQAKIIEFQSLAKVLDSIPLTIVIEQSLLHFASVELEQAVTATALKCRNIHLEGGFLLSPKVNRRRANVTLKLPSDCKLGDDSLASDGLVEVKADKDEVVINFQSKNSLTLSGSRFDAHFDLRSSLTTDIQTLMVSVRKFDVEPFLRLKGGLSAELGAPATLRFEPLEFRLEHKGLPQAVHQLLSEQGLSLRDGKLRADINVSDVELSSLITAPLQALKAEASIKLDELSLTQGPISIRRLRSTYEGQLTGGRLTGTHSTTIGSLRELQQDLRLKGLTFQGRDDILFTAFHGESTEVILPGTYGLTIASLANPSVTVKNFALTLRPQLGMKGLEPQWLMAKPRIQVERVTAPKITASNFGTELELRYALLSEEAKLKANWKLDSAVVNKPTEGVAESHVTDLSGESALRWRGRKQRVEIESLTQNFGDWAQLKLEDAIVELARGDKIMTEGSLEAWWKEVPEFVAQIFAQQDLSIQSDGVTRWSWEGELPSPPQATEGVCHVETLQTMVSPAQPRFQADGEIRINTLDIETPETTVKGGKVLLGINYDLNELLRISLKSESLEVQQQENRIESLMLEGLASLTPEAIAVEHSLTIGSLQSPESERIEGHVASGTMEYRFNTSRINGEFSLNNQTPALNALTRFKGDSFGNWLCNSGILEGDLLGLPLITSSLKLSVGEKNRTLRWGERELDGKVLLNANVVLQEKQIDLTGDVEFANNDLLDPAFKARGITGTLPITQRVLYRSVDESCLSLPMLPKQVCVVVGGKEGVQVGLQREPTIRIAALTSQELTISRMSAEASYRSGWFGLRDYAAEFLDGDLRGDIYFGINQALGFDSRFSLKVSDLQLSRLLPKRFRRGKKTRANFVFDAGLRLSPGVSDLDVELAVTRLEPDALDALMRALEQKTGLAQVSEARSNLRWIDFRGMNVWIRHEGLNIELDYDPIVIGYRPIPRSLMKRYSLRDWVFEPIIEAQMVPILRDLLGWETRDVL